MTPPTPTTDEQMFEDDVNYGIADCRRRRAQARRARARSQRSTLRAQRHPPKYNLDELPPEPATNQLEELEEALIT
jgi:hypothetical protein